MFEDALSLKISSGTSSAAEPAHVAVAGDTGQVFSSEENPKVCFQSKRKKKNPVNMFFVFIWFGNMAVFLFTNTGSCISALAFVSITWKQLWSSTYPIITANIVLYQSPGETASSYYETEYFYTIEKWVSQNVSLQISRTSPKATLLKRAFLKQKCTTLEPHSFVIY